MSLPVLGQMTGGSSGEPHVDLKPIDNSEAEDALRAAETVCQLANQQISQEVEESQELLIFPEGEVDAVTITARDVEGLQPGKFLSNNIVDFYMRFLERGLSPEERIRFHFFSSFFFTKLLLSTVSTGIDPCKVDYKELKNWTKEVDLFAKDYVFIPILKSSHWSLVVICHLSDLIRPPGEMMRSPCVVHLDPIEEQHESFEGWIRSYVLQAWMPRFQSSSNGDQLLALCQMKYMKAKVPQQDNSHDCGLHVLNYIEAFLAKSTSPDFSFPSSEVGPHFFGPHFVREVLGKREHIQNRIHELSGISQKRARKRRAIQEVRQSTQNLRLLLFDEGNSEEYIKDVQTAGPAFFNGGASTREVALGPQDGLISSVDNEPLDGPQIAPMEYEDRIESFSSTQQYVEPKVQTGGSTHFNGSIFVARHAPTYADAFDVQHQQSNGIPRLDGPEFQHAECPSSKRSEVQKGKNKRNMTKEETLALIRFMVEGGCHNKSGLGTNWELISEKIGPGKDGCLFPPLQCRYRYDTLVKAYNTYNEFLTKTGKKFSEITQKERLGLKVATILSEEMYTDMGRNRTETKALDGPQNEPMECEDRSGSFSPKQQYAEPKVQIGGSTMDEVCTEANISQKRMKLSSTVRNNLHPLSSPDSPAPNPPPISRGRSFEDEAVILDSASGALEAALRNVIPASVLSFFDEDLQSTLLNLVQECSSKVWSYQGKDGITFDLKSVCRRLAVLQDREPREILNYVFKLWKLDFVNVVGRAFEEGNDPAHTGLWEVKTWFLKSELYKKISEEVLCKDPQFQTHCQSYPFEQSSNEYIRALRLGGCDELEHLDLSEFPSLRSLSIWDCPKLNSVRGWEVPTGLGLLEIWKCHAYLDFPEGRSLLSLRDIDVSGRKSSKSAIPWPLSQISRCANLRRLRIEDEESFSEIADLENLKELKSLEFLSLRLCSFSSIRGLSGLRALRRLELKFCRGLRSVPGLGCLKGLTHLDMSCSGVENIQGVEELYLLTFLDLSYCFSLEGLPFLGHLEALVYLDLWRSDVKRIRSRKDLMKIKTLRWA